jgi:hypothetical protein
MPESAQPPSPPPPATLTEEMAKIPYEPLLPVEKKLIAWSLVLGIALLAVLVWISSTFFAVPVESP